jgi:hypothetical protein
MLVSSCHLVRSLEDAWCEYARRRLLQVSAVVRPLHVAAETARAIARAAGVLDDDGDRSTTLFVASTDGGSGSIADSFSELYMQRPWGHGPLCPSASARLTPSPDHLAWLSVG